MKNNNDVVIIELDRPRELRFGHKALKTYQSISGKGIEEFGSDFSFAEVEKLMYCGLLSDSRKHGESLKIEDMEDLLDLAPYEEIIEKMTEALNASFGTVPNKMGVAANK
jgi:predicted solute-binding protein